MAPVVSVFMKTDPSSAIPVPKSKCSLSWYQTGCSGQREGCLRPRTAQKKCWSVGSEILRWLTHVGHKIHLKFSLCFQKEHNRENKPIQGIFQNSLEGTEIYSMICLLKS